MKEQAIIINNKTVAKHISPEDVIEIVENTWRWFGEGKIIMPSKVTTDMSALGIDGWFNSMPSYVEPYDAAGLKLVGGYLGNKKVGLPYIKANLLLTDPRTGLLRALISGDYISDMRTGAQPAVAAKYLAAKTDVVTIIGAGLQASMSLLCMSKILNIKEVRVCDINVDARKNFIHKFINSPFKMIDCASNEDGCRGSDVIITITTADAVLVQEPWIKKGALVMTMGSYTEVSDDVVIKSDMIAVDHVGQSLHRGNLKSLSDRGLINASSIGIVITDLIAGKIPGRKTLDDRIYVELVGMGCLDLAVASVVYQKVISADADEMTVVDMIG
ncbi:MAG: ornithine cyclodeaminase family protein [Clostridiaceae bacterium]|nr:ornithine cyclodeaminase family protein [Clostridiaceae bacterium]